MSQPSTPAQPTVTSNRIVTLPAGSPITSEVVRELDLLLDLVPPQTLRRHIDDILLQLLATDTQVVEMPAIAESYILLFRFLEMVEKEINKNRFDGGEVLAAGVPSTVDGPQSTVG